MATLSTPVVAEAGSARDGILRRVAARILALRIERPIRVGVDGATASGKSTLARELSEILKAAGRPVIQTSLDGFHHPRARRYARGRGSAEGYYYDAYDYEGIVENLLLPFGPEGSRRYRTEILNLATDLPIEPATPATAASDAILVVDGSFALRPELRPHWDFRIFLSVAFDVAEERAVRRDAQIFGSAEEARSVVRGRYHGAHRLHAELARPLDFAHVVIQNDDPQHPRILVERD